MLTTLCSLCAPYIPFMTENMYQNLVVNNIPGAKESVHLTDFPKADMALVDKELEDDMEAVIAIVQLGRACRSAANMKVRQPSRALYVKGAKLPEAMAALIADELNVKNVEFVDDARAFTSYKIKPQLRTLGPRYGKLLGKISAYLAQADGNDVVDTFDRGEKLTFDVDGTNVELAREDTLIEPMQKSGFMAESEGDLTVVLDTNLTPELIEEGFVREVISKIQTMRKEAGYEVTDRITVTCATDEKLAAIIARGEKEICRAVLAEKLKWARPPRTPTSRNGTSTAKTPCLPPEGCGPEWSRGCLNVRQPRFLSPSGGVGRNNASVKILSLNTAPFPLFSP